jgi:PAS domain S-box-containing protein
MQTAIDFQQLVNAIGDAVIMSDAGGSITLWNPAAERMFGFTQSEARGNSLDLIIPERLRGRHWDGYHKTMATGEIRYGNDVLRVPRHAQGRAGTVDFLYGCVAAFAAERAHRHRRSDPRRNQPLPGGSFAAQASCGTGSGRRRVSGHTGKFS